MKQIRRLGMANHELPIAAESVDTFFSEALPVLKQVSPIEIEEKVTKEMVEHPLRAKLYLQEKDNMIVGKLTYHYGNQELDPFVSKEVIVRLLLSVTLKKNNR